MKNKLKQNYQPAKTFSNTFRYIDDPLILNNLHLKEELTNIYPPQLVLKKTTTETESRLSCLDLELSSGDRKFTTAVFDKRDGFSFHIANFPYIDSNIPSKPAYGVYDFMYPS